MPFKIAADLDALLHNEERIGVQFTHDGLQRFDLVLGQTHA